MSDKVTIKDIARLSNTSKTTVSFYLNGKLEKMSKQTQDKIKQVIEETGYQPSMIARSLNNKKSNLLGVIVQDITNNFANQIVKGINEVAQNRGYQLILASCSYDEIQEEQAVKRMIQLGVDGFIVQPTTKFELIESEIMALDKPIVSVDSQSQNPHGYWVKTNNCEAVSDAIKKMMDLYENFVYIASEPGVLSTRMERKMGYEKPLLEKNRSWKTLYIENDTDVNVIEQWLSDNLDIESTTCIFVPHCWALPKVHLALQKYKNLIPEHIGLIGFDNIEWTELSVPTITTIVQPALEEGKEACDMLIDVIEDCYEGEMNQILKCTLNLQESTKKNS